MERVWKILLIGVYLTSKATGQVSDNCTWSPPDLLGRVHAIRSDAEYFINSTTTLQDGISYTWTYASVIAVQLKYSSTGDGSFSLLSANPRVEASATKVTEDLVLLYARVKAVTSSDNGNVLQVSRNSCVTGRDGAAVTLTVAECTRDPYGDVADFVGVFPSPCGLGCKVNFTCAIPECGAFEAECLADATWTPAQHNCSSTCAALPPSMVFTGPATNVQCGMTENITCSGASAQMCGSTIGRCSTRDNNVMLDDATFNCTKVCNVQDFSGVEVPASNPVCGEFAVVQCLVCNGTTISRQCGQNGTWTDTTSCSNPTCNEVTIRSVCGNGSLCDFGNVTNLTCGEQLDYTCAPGAENTIQFPVYCVAENELNYTGTVCEVTPTTDVPCSATCNEDTIKSICNMTTQCDYGRVTNLTCGEQLVYNCISEEVPSTSSVYCIGKNELNVNSSLCSTAGKCSDCNNGAGLSDGAIAGIVLGVLFVCGVAVAGTIFAFKSGFIAQATPKADAKVVPEAVELNSPQTADA